MITRLPRFTVASPRPVVQGSNPTLSLSRASNPNRQHVSRAPHCQGASSDDLASEFSRVVNERAAAGVREVQDPVRKPSHLLPPTSAIAAVLDALQRNDWPEANSGLDTAFAFTKAAPQDDLAPAAHLGVRAWSAKEEWLHQPSFRSHLLSPPYDVLINCEEWTTIGTVQFPSSQTDARAVQAVQVRTHNRTYTFSFCMQRADQGSLKGCWLIAGVRQGDYSV